VPEEEDAEGQGLPEEVTLPEGETDSVGLLEWLPEALGMPLAEKLGDWEAEDVRQEQELADALTEPGPEDTELHREELTLGESLLEEQPDEELLPEREEL